MTPPPSPAGITAIANGGNRGTKIDNQARYQALISGLLAFYQPGDKFDLKSGVMTRDELVAELERYIAAAEETKASQAVWRNDVQAERAVELSVRPLRQGVRGILAAKFGRDGAQLLQFGFSPSKKPKKTVASKSAAVAKSGETRKLRGTKGKKAKLAIKAGNAPTPTPAPPAASPAPQAPAPAAPAATSGTPAAGSGGTQHA